MRGVNETNRVETFSDGVFAIAATLLILEIKIPPVSSIHSAADLWRGLAKLWPSYFAFVLSFGFILLWWVCHHITFNFIIKTSPGFLYANGFLLLMVVFLPFATAMLAGYVMTDYRQPAVVFYCFNQFLGNVGWNVFYTSALKSGIAKKDDASVAELKGMLRNNRFGFVIYGCTTILAWWFPIVALIITTLLWMLWIRMSIAWPVKK